MGLDKHLSKHAGTMKFLLATNMKKDIRQRSFFFAFIFLCSATFAFSQTTNSSPPTRHSTLDTLPLDDLRQLRLPEVVLDAVSSVAADQQKNPNRAAYVE